MKWKQSANITRHSASIERASETTMSWKNSRKVIALKETATKDGQKNAGDSQATSNVGSMKTVHTGTLGNIMHQVKVK